MRRGAPIKRDAAGANYRFVADPGIVTSTPFTNEDGGEELRIEDQRKCPWRLSRW